MEKFVGETEQTERKKSGFRSLMVDTRYLLGGQGMNVLPPQLFLDYDELYLRVRFDNGDGQGLRNLTPYQRITATPRALLQRLAKTPIFRFWPRWLEQQTRSKREVSPPPS